MEEYPSLPIIPPDLFTSPQARVDVFPKLLVLPPVPSGMPSHRRRRPRSRNTRVRIVQAKRKQLNLSHGGSWQDVSLLQRLSTHVDNLAKAMDQPSDRAVGSVLDEDGKGGYRFDRMTFKSPIDILGFFLGYMSGPIIAESEPTDDQ